MDIKIVDKIHSLENKHHIYIATILRKYKDIKFNENKSGIMINASNIPPDAITEIIKYLEYIDKQQAFLQKIEQRTEDLKELVN
jgi:hypothetical protein